MDHFFVSPLLLDEIELFFIAYGLIILGGVIGSLIFTVRSSLRRVAYFCWFAVLYFLLIVSQMILVAMPTAADGGYLSALIIVAFSLSFVYGAALYYISTARSNHIGEGANNVWLAFVPIANLWLFFKRGGQDTSDTDLSPASSSRLR